MKIPLISFKAAIAPLDFQCHAECWLHTNCKSVLDLFSNGHFRHVFCNVTVYAVWNFIDVKMNFKAQSDFPFIKQGGYAQVIGRAVREEREEKDNLWYGYHVAMAIQRSHFRSSSGLFESPFCRQLCRYPISQQNKGIVTS